MHTQIYVFCLSVLVFWIYTGCALLQLCLLFLPVLFPSTATILVAIKCGREGSRNKWWIPSSNSLPAQISHWRIDEKKCKRYMKCMWDVIIQHLINILGWGIQLFSLNTPHQYKTILNQSQPKIMKIHVTFISCLSITEPLSNQIIRTQTFGFSYTGLTYVHLIWEKGNTWKEDITLWFIYFIYSQFI